MNAVFPTTIPCCAAVMAIALGAATSDAQAPAALASCAAPVTAPLGGAPPLALATFDTAWTVIHTRHFDTTFNGVDWNDVRAELRPRAAAAASIADLRAVLRDMVARLGQSHFSIIPMEASREDPDAGGDGDTGIRTRYVDDEAIVFDV